MKLQINTSSNIDIVNKLVNDLETIVCGLTGHEPFALAISGCLGTSKRLQSALVQSSTPARQITETEIERIRQGN